MMVGSGRQGYYNVTGRDPMVHSLSARGIKQPQRAFMAINPAIRRYSNVKLEQGAVKEHIEHPKFTMEQARQIAKDHLTENPRAYGKMPNVNQIIAYENGEMNDKDTLKFFSELTKSGQVWQLQGHYGRTAAALIEDGYMDRKGNLTPKAKTFIKQGLGGKCGGKLGGYGGDYKIVRFYADGRPSKTIARGLTEEEAQGHCSLESTHKKDAKGNVIWFDGYTKGGKGQWKRGFYKTGRGYVKVVDWGKEVVTGGKMSRKDYIKMAKILGTSDNVGEVHSKYADYAQEDNPRFDRGRFYSAVQKAKETK